MLPIYLKGSITFKLEERQFSYEKQNLSAYGVSGLPWGGLDPIRHFAQKVKVTLKLDTPELAHFTTDAQIIREATQTTEHMGFKFGLSPEQHKRINELVSRYGFFPTEYMRKYPRIPSLSAVPTFPLRVQATPLDITAHPHSHAKFSKSKIKAIDHIFDVGNLSPNGMLLSTESVLAQSLLPGHRLLLRLEPRGNFPISVEMEGLICRIVDDINSRNGNTIRYLGIKFTVVDEENRAIFLDLLKDILENLKTLKR